MNFMSVYKVHDKLKKFIFVGFEIQTLFVLTTFVPISSLFIYTVFVDSEIKLM